MGTTHREDPARPASADCQPSPPHRRSRSPGLRRVLLYTVVDALDEIAKETGKTVPQIAINWLLQRPTVSTVIIGARNEEQLRANLGSVGWSLTDDQMARLDAASEVTWPYPYWHQRSSSSRRACGISRPMRVTCRSGVTPARPLP